MKFYPKLETSIEAEQYDGTPESVERINALLKTTGKDYKIAKQKGGMYLFSDWSWLSLVNPENFVCVGNGQPFIRRKNDLEKNYSVAPMHIKASEDLCIANERIERLEANALESAEEYKLAVQWITELKAARLRIAELETQIAALQKPLPCSTVENMPPEGLNLSECIGMIAELWDETQDVIKESCYEKHPYEISDRPYTEKGFAWGRTLEDGLNVKEILYKRQ